ncbi:hypothetical protein ACIQ1S_09630 [Streptomyces griseus]|uniref:hypothetical protein n=1 Tax=Streptomyces griseus TaxID=1911 RepID=UPI0037FFE41B
MTTQPERVQLNDLTEDALAALYERLDLLEAGRDERVALLEEARDALEAAGAGRVHGDDWPRLVPAIDELAAEVKILRARVNAQNEAADVAVSAIRLMNEAGAQRDYAEARVRGLEGIVARVTRAVDTGPVGSCCTHIIRAALTPPTGLCGCGRTDPGPCTPCPQGSTSLHCACVCEPAPGAA